MWYVIWTSSGQEKKAESALLDSQVVSRSFIPKRIMLFKKQGKWERLEKTLFPGYFFVDCDDLEALSDNVRRVEGFNQILRTEKKPTPLYGKDAEFIEKLYNKEGLFDISEGYIEGDQIIVTSGPLVGQEGMIKKIDRHKRMAYVEFDMFDQIIQASVALEIVEKRP